MSYVELLGYLAGFLLFVCDLPQLYKTYKTKSAGDLSGWMIVLWCLGSACMLSYIALTGQQVPLLITYSFTTTVGVVMLILYLRHR